MAPPPNRDGLEAPADDAAPKSDGVLVELKMLVAPKAAGLAPKREPVAAAELAPKMDAEDAGGGKENCGLVASNMAGRLALVSPCWPGAKVQCALGH